MNIMSFAPFEVPSLSHLCIIKLRCGARYHKSFHTGLDIGNNHMSSVLLLWTGKGLPLPKARNAKVNIASCCGVRGLHDLSNTMWHARDFPNKSHCYTGLDFYIANTD